MKINKILAGLLVAGVCGAGLTVMASSNDGSNNRKPIEVKPQNGVSETSNYNGGAVTVSEIEKYIVSKYGENWATDLSVKNGNDWDDILEDELEMYFGEKYDDLIEAVVNAKEHELGLDDLDDHNDND